MVTALVWEKPAEYKIEPVDQDGLWKKVIRELFEDFLLFFSPELHAQVDFSIETEFLQQELFQEIIKDKTGRRSTDQLVKVHLKGGEEKWILVHIEVQSDNGKDFAKRMFQYFYRIYDQYDKELVALALMTSPYRSKFPTEFRYNYFGTELHYAYTTSKLVDYNYAELEQSDKLFSKVILAAKYMHDTKNDMDKRYVFKMKLMREMIRNKPYPGAEIQAIFYFIDYLLRLPEDLSRKLNNTLIPIIQKEVNDVVQFDNGEWSPTMEAVFARIKEDWVEEGKAKGLEQGIEQGVTKVVLEMLKKELPVDVIAEVTHLKQEKIEQLRETLQ
ncbi:Rpn family recombination-promoting nuclease/putative transposase [Sporosarcina sp. FSL K6-1522]|uniref:Rpn family recombination-promoting nuclease/putative transposase n=1 Tax=Sporosarcina sp. FSL K6-1522 TaxID=2921554 RepID=UPI003159A62D